MINRLRPWWKLIIFILVLIWHFVKLMFLSILGSLNLERGFRIRRNFCRAAIRVFNIDLHLKGAPVNSNALYISNHRSMLDPLIELTFLEVYILSKSDVAEYPMIGKGAKKTGVFFVDRDSDNSRKAALQTIEKFLTAGFPILLYPEGTTNGGNLTADFRKGAFEIAFNNNIPVVPIMIEYPDPSYYWTDDTLMDYFRKVFSRSGKHKVVVEIGETIFATNKEELVIKTRAAIDAMILEARKNF